MSLQISALYSPGYSSIPLQKGFQKLPPRVLANGEADLPKLDQRADVVVVVVVVGGR